MVKKQTLSENDIERRNTIAQLLGDWGLIAIVNATRLLKIKHLYHKSKFYHLKKKVNGTYKQSIT